MLKQTRNALIYSDLALFVIDTREGITYNDVALYNWLTSESLKLSSDSIKKSRSKKDLPEDSMVTIDELEKVSEVSYSLVD